MHLATKNNGLDFVIGRDDTGGVSLKGIIGLLVVAGIVWGAVIMLPTVQVPDQLQKIVKEECKEWLRLRARDQSMSAKHRTEKIIKEAIAELLAEHTYDPKNLDINFIGSQSVNVTMPYTININLYGFELTFEKELNIQENAVSF